ncbi:MAG: superoxide dismutase family protein [Legionellaceae bacterium]|nr:superoxide dismutase family protein [Legionellaceae bacterium]
MKAWMSGFGVLLLSTTVYAASLEVTVFSAADKGGKDIGTVVFEDSQFGLLITPHLKDLPPGLRGFHVHEMPDCADHGMEAGGHYDPAKTNTHLGPYRNGHLGDLPALYVDEKGHATLPNLAPRLKLKDLYGRALMVHAGGDNYSDTPPLGGGGARIACGVIKEKKAD